MAEQGFTEEDFLTWIPAHEAYRIVGNVVGNPTAFEMLKRLSLGLLIARFEYAFHIIGNSKKALPQFQIVGEKIWENVAKADSPTQLTLWSANSINVDAEGPTSLHSPTVKIAMLGIRFDPIGIKRMDPKRILPEPPAAPAPAVPVVILPIVEPEIKGTPVSKAALEVWFKAYQSAYSGADDTEARALESAKGCFPGKSVSRDAVRELRGTQKRGPKSKTAE